MLDRDDVVAGVGECFLDTGTVSNHARAGRKCSLNERPLAADRSLAPSRARFLLCRRPFSSTEACSLANARFLSSYSPAQLYELVSDVGAYSSFIPFCTSSTVLNASGGPASGWKPGREPFSVEAELAVGFGGLSERYVSKVVGEPFVKVSVSTRASTRAQRACGGGGEGWSALAGCVVGERGKC